MWVVTTASCTTLPLKFYQFFRAWPSRSGSFMAILLRNLVHLWSKRSTKIFWSATTILFKRQCLVTTILLVSHNPSPVCENNSQAVSVVIKCRPMISTDTETKGGRQGRLVTALSGFLFKFYFWMTRTALENTLCIFGLLHFSSL